MIYWIALAWALDFVPRHDGSSQEPPDVPSLDETEPRQTAATDARPDTTIAVPFDAAGDASRDQGWFDPPSLQLALTGEHGRRYYLVATAFVGRDQYHWQQGPFDAPDMTLSVGIEVPEEVAEAVRGKGTAHLAFQLSSTDFGETSIRFHEPPESIYLLHDGTALVGAARNADVYPLETEAPQ